MAKEGKKSKKDKESKKAKGSKAKGSGTSNKTQGSEDAQIVRKLDGSIALSKLKHVVMIKKGKGGKKIEGIFIPVDANFIERGKDGAFYLGVKVNIKDQRDTYNQDGFISQSVTSAVYKAASEKEQAEMKKTPILGGVIDWEYSGSSSNDASGSQGTVNEDDDLPF